MSGRCDFTITTEGLVWTYRFEVGNGKLIQAIDPQAGKLLVVEDGDAIDMSDYLSDAQPTFYRTDLSCVEETTLYPNRGAGEPFDEGSIEAVDWRRAGIDIESEKEKTANGDSIFSWVIEKARSMGDKLVFCDDNAGEVADFITASCDLGSPIVRFFHCKGSGAQKPGGRQGDFYEVLGQALRTSVWFDMKRLHDRLDYRRKGKFSGSSREVSRSLRGSMTLGTHLPEAGFTQLATRQHQRVQAVRLRRVAAIAISLAQPTQRECQIVHRTLLSFRSSSPEKQAVSVSASSSEEGSPKGRLEANAKWT